jgi:hypothetical protein
VRVVIAPLSRSYAEARAAFLDAARDARVQSFPHPLLGVDGGALAVDVAEIGPVDADDVVLVVSGTHGVEGYLGSALQRHHLAGLGRDRTTGPAIVFVHTLNPYGCSWVRRVNEDNVDLNRNFVDWSQPPPTNPDYAELADLLVPTSWTAEVQEQTLVGLLAAVERLGMARMQEIIQGGQFDHPTGVFYGGTGPTWSHRWLRDFAARRFATVRRLAIVDLHTGLGPWGHGSLLSSSRTGSAELAREIDWWGGDVTPLDASLGSDGAVSAAVTGDWLAAAPGLAPHAEVTSICIEYGTVDGITVLQALRADAVMHGHGDPTGPDAAAVRAQVRAAFVDDDPAWLAACWTRYDAVLTAAFDRLTR